MKSNVEVVQVETVKAGKVDRLVLHYKAERTKGEVWKIGALSVKLSDVSRATLKAAKPGDVISVDIEKEGQYFNLISASTDTTATPTASAARATSSTGGAKTSGYDNLGQQIGNSITNAVNSLGTGKTSNDYKQRAIEFILMGDDIRELVTSGNIKPLAKGAASVEQTSDDDSTW